MVEGFVGDVPTTIQTFLIADVRGYTLFTQERGDEAAAKLAARFARVAREAVQRRTGSVVELRGDEVLAVFCQQRRGQPAARRARLADLGQLTVPNGTSSV
jgi:class 3 adenylate cyclase